MPSSMVLSPLAPMTQLHFSESLHTNRKARLCVQRGWQALLLSLLYLRRPVTVRLTPVRMAPSGPEVGALLSQVKRYQRAELWQARHRLLRFGVGAPTLGRQGGDVTLTCEQLGKTSIESHCYVYPSNIVGHQTQVSPSSDVGM